MVLVPTPPPPVRAPLPPRSAHPSCLIKAVDAAVRTRSGKLASRSIAASVHGGALAGRHPRARGAAAALGVVHARGGLRRADHRVRRGLLLALRRGQHGALARRPRRPHHPQPLLRLRLHLLRLLPPRLLQRRHQAAQGSHRRRRRRLLPVQRRRVREEPRRAGLRVPGEPAAARVEDADQRVRQRQHRPRPRGALPHALRPHRRGAPLLHPLVLQGHHLLRRRHAHPRGAPQRRHGAGLSVQAHGTLRHHLGRLHLGHRQRQVQGQLQARALHRRVLRPGPPRLPRRGRHPPAAPPPSRVDAPLRRGRVRADDRRLRHHDAAEAHGHAAVPAEADALHRVLRHQPLPFAVPGVRRQHGGAPEVLGVGRVQGRPPARPRPLKAPRATRPPTGLHAASRLIHHEPAVHVLTT